jgi:hypothetical protein
MNAKRSTGPRTERGKNNSKFNAVTTGLFADHVVIPSCDGGPYEDDDDPEEQFARLLEGLQHEYKPEGPSETFWVAQMAECMWKQRRVSRSERGLVHATMNMQSSDGRKRTVEQALYGISVFETALKEIENTRALSPVTYARVLPYLEMVQTGVLKMRRLETTKDGGPNEAKVDDQFVASLEEAKAKTERVVGDLVTKERRADYYAARALPWEEDLDRILRYDKALQKKFDWALQRLLESQRRRQKA